MILRHFFLIVIFVLNGLLLRYSHPPVCANDVYQARAYILTRLLAVYDVD